MVLIKIYTILSQHIERMFIVEPKLEVKFYFFAWRLSYEMNNDKLWSVLKIHLLLWVASGVKNVLVESFNYTLHFVNSNGRKPILVPRGNPNDLSQLVHSIMYYFRCRTKAISFLIFERATVKVEALIFSIGLVYRSKLPWKNFLFIWCIFFIV